MVKNCWVPSWTYRCGWRYLMGAAIIFPCWFLQSIKHRYFQQLNKGCLACKEPGVLQSFVNVILSPIERAVNVILIETLTMRLFTIASLARFIRSLLSWETDFETGRKQRRNKQIVFAEKFSSSSWCIPIQQKFLKSDAFCKSLPTTVSYWWMPFFPRWKRIKFQKTSKGQWWLAKNIINRGTFPLLLMDHKGTGTEELEYTKMKAPRTESPQIKPLLNAGNWINRHAPHKHKKSPWNWWATVFEITVVSSDNEWANPAYWWCSSRDQPDRKTFTTYKEDSQTNLINRNAGICTCKSW